MWADFIKYIDDLNTVSITIRLCLAVICGGIIGLDRGIKGQAAGCRTHMLVCLGSALAMMTNIFILENYGGNVDPARIGAQVVSGIGFLGAGTILVTNKNQVKGLTTAAGLWASACMGLAIGIGFYQVAIIGNILIFAIITFFKKVDKKVYSISRYMEIYVEFENSGGLENIISFARKKRYEIDDIQILKNDDINRTGAVFMLKTKKRMEHSQIIAELSDVKGIFFIEEL